MNAAMTSGHRRESADAALGIVIMVVAVLADVLAFNQFATQSAIDAIVQLSFVGVGIGGALEALRRLVLGPTVVDRLLGVPLAVASVVALAGWRAQWPIGWSVLCCLVAGIVVMAIGARRMARSERTSAVAVLTLTQAMVLLWFAAVVAVDARGVLFG